MKVTITRHNRNHLLRYRRIQELFNKEYNVKRRRLDDVYEEIFNVYCIGRERVNVILKMDIPETVEE